MLKNILFGIGAFLVYTTGVQASNLAIIDTSGDEVYLQRIANSLLLTKCYSVSTRRGADTIPNVGGDLNSF